MFLFVVVPNNSGSTLIHRILETSPNVTSLQKEIWFDKENPKSCWCEGSDVRLADRSDYVANYMPHRDSRLFTNLLYYYKDYNFDMIKKFWFKSWDMSKKIKIEKTPDNVMKAVAFSYNFKPSKFIISLRNPYAFCNSMLSNGIDVRRSARHWLNCAEKQIINIKYTNSYFISYEKICEDPKKFIDELIQFENSLEDLKCEKIVNKNNYDNLEKKDFKIINKELKKEVLDYFKYKIIN